MNDRLKKLRDALTDEQRKLLNSFWKKVLDTGTWPTQMEVHQKITKGKTIELLRSVGGNLAFAGHIVQEDHATNGSIYKLSLIGILMTRDGEQYERWLIRLLEFFRKNFYHKRTHAQTQFGDAQIGQTLKLSGEKLRILGELTRYTTNMYFQSHGHTQGNSWQISRPHNIDDLPPTGSLESHFEQELFKYCTNSSWVFRADALRQPGTAVSAAAVHNNLVTPALNLLTDLNMQPSESVKIFISHSSHDKKLLEALTDLLKSAFALRAKDILCTSVPGHKLAGGADTEEALLGPLGNAKLLIGVLTPASLQSSYVLFELGARWGLKQPLISLVACGAQMKDLKEPLKSKNALNAAEEHDVHQLIEDVGKCLGQGSEPTSAYNSKIRRFVLAARKIAPTKKIS